MRAHSSNHSSRRRHSRRDVPQQQGTILCQTLLVAQHRGVIPVLVHQRSIIRRRGIRRAVSSRNDSRSLLITHAIRPQVAHLPRQLDLRCGPRGTVIDEDVGEGGVHDCRDVVAVDEEDDHVVLGAACGGREAAGPHLDCGSTVDVGSVGGIYPAAGGAAARRVLVYGDYGGVRDYGEVGWFNYSEVVSENQGALCGGPCTGLARSL